MLIIDRTVNPSTETLDGLDTDLPELIQDYVLKSAISYPLEREFEPASKYQLISERESRSMFVSDHHALKDRSK